MTFDLEKLVKIGKAYNLETNIRTMLKEGDSGDGSDGSTDNANTLVPISNAENRDTRLVVKENIANSEPEIENIINLDNNESSHSPPEPSQLSQPSPLKQSDSLYSCYHIGCGFQTDDEQDYQRHGALKHHKNPLLYPSKAEIKAYGLQSQGKIWEV